MKRSPMTRTTPRPAAEWTGDTLPTARVVPLRIADTRARLTVPLPKMRPARSETYRRLVAAMPCANCGRHGPSQCAHADAGKGMAIKADDRDTFPACADGPVRLGCHRLIGATGMFTREHRRTLESKYAAQTRAQIVADGNWPANLPKWDKPEINL